VLRRRFRPGRRTCGAFFVHTRAGLPRGDRG